LIQENVVIYKSTILNYCMVSISIYSLFFSSAEELLVLIDNTDNDRNLHVSKTIRQKV